MFQMLFTLIVPVLSTIILIIWFKNQTALWEYAIPYAVTILWAIIFYYIGIGSVTKDKEYFGNYITEVRYYEPWNEWISQTCTRTCCCDSKGENCSTETYDCSYVRYHSAEWIAILNDGSEHYISESYYNSLVSKFNNGNHFTDLGRDYYTEDGDMYYTTYANNYAALEPYYREHSYENKIQASYSVFNFPTVKETDIKKYNLFEYPEIKSSNSFNAILTHGYPVSQEAQFKFDYLNATLGMSKQVRVWVLLFNASEHKSFYMQKGYWKGGNKNEFIICLGMNRDGTVAWYEPMGWSKNKLIEVETRDFVLDKKLDLMKLGSFMYSEVEKNWTRTEFKQFDYLEIDVPRWAVITSWILSIISTALIMFWTINNEFTLEDPKGYY